MTNEQKIIRAYEDAILSAYYYLKGISDAQKTL